MKIYQSRCQCCKKCKALVWPTRKLVVEEVRRQMLSQLNGIQFDQVVLFTFKGKRVRAVVKFYDTNYSVEEMIGQNLSEYFYLHFYEVDRDDKKLKVADCLLSLSERAELNDHLTPARLFERVQIEDQK